MAIIGNMTGSSDVSINLATQIRDVLNAAGGSVSNDVTSFFKPAAKLNMWSKYKPVVSTTLFHTFSNWKTQGYRGDSGTCGLTIPYYTDTSMSSFRTYLENGTALWNYTPPSGGTGAPMRVGDFRGYNTEAYNPVGDFFTNGIMDSDGYITVSMDATVTDPTYNLTYSDIYIDSVPLTDYYLGVYAFNDSGTWKYATNTSPIGDSYDFTVSLQLVSKGKWNIVPFLCSVAQTGKEATGTYLSANVLPKSISVIAVNAVRTLSVNAIWKDSTKSSVVVEEFYFQNDGASSYTFTDIIVYVFRTGLDAVSGAEGTQVGSYVHSGSVTVSGNSSESVSVGVEITRINADTNNYLYWVGAASSASDGSVVVWQQVEESANEEAYVAVSMSV